ncbi:DUF6270 domain-containing protein [Brochothrix campestris]|uniref:Uncharacterized protein n=1 Tax=Brochothrix campestris FSL F6-1037 TaxID=1265861 RepID=W7CRJ1_9LIST|nr:DUF6270 domain-containing protein [Brochothrix campestris]EUJ39240.1 hypothetical protein BCAMP_07580 [Brochothrix campestris FSL F6-1037]
MLPKMTSFGACVSRDLFKSSIVRDYKDFFAFSNDQYHMSVVSLMSQPLSEELLGKIPAELEGKVNPFVKKCFKEDLTKVFLRKIATNEQDYLLLDFYMDTYYGVIELQDGSYVSGKQWQYQKIDFYNKVVKQEVKAAINPLTDRAGYLVLWKDSIDRFMAYIKQESPETTIILNTKKFTNRYFNSDTKSFEDLSVVIKDKKRTAATIERMNDIWTEMDTYLLTRYPEVKALRFDEERYYSSAENEWGPFYLHFNQAFYDDAQQQLIKLVMEERGYFKLEEVLPGGICKKVGDDVQSFADVREWGDYYIPMHQYEQMIDKPTRDAAGYFLKNHPQSASGYFIQELTRASLKTNIESYRRIVTRFGQSNWNKTDLGDEVIYLDGTIDLKAINTTGEYYMSDKVTRTIEDHPTKNSGWFLTVSKRTGDSCMQELTKKTQIDENMQRYYRILNFKENTATKWNAIGEPKATREHSKKSWRSRLTAKWKA